jgi:hypothetical protein
LVKTLLIRVGNGKLVLKLLSRRFIVLACQSAVPGSPAVARTKSNQSSRYVAIKGFIICSQCTCHSFTYLRADFLYFFLKIHVLSGHAVFHATISGQHATAAIRHSKRTVDTSWAI